MFPISRDPPEGGTLHYSRRLGPAGSKFPISRDPPEGGTLEERVDTPNESTFPISRDPPEGGTAL